MTTVAVSGMASTLGTRVRVRLEAVADLGPVVAWSDAEPPAEGLDVLVDLDTWAEPERVRQRCRAAVAAGARSLVHLSSMEVYGAHPDNEVPLVEEHPRRPCADFPRAEHHDRVEQAIDAWRRDHAPVAVAVLRPAMVVGADEPPLLVDAFVGGRTLGVRGHRPPMQFLHVDDLAAAVVHAARHELDGVYNVAAEGWLSADEIEAILGRHRLEVPEEVVFTSVERLRTTGLSSLPLGAVHHLVHPWVASVDRLVATGWRPGHSNRDAMATLAADHGDRVALGPLVTTRRQVRRATGTAVGVAGGLLALGIAARRRGGRTSS